MSHQDDTQPKAPAGLRETLSDTAPFHPTDPIPPSGAYPPVEEDSRLGFSGIALMLGVVGMASCLCILIISLSGLAGLRDEIEAIRADSTAEQGTAIANQYALAQEDARNGNIDLALQRYQFILDAVPDYQDTRAQVQALQTIAAYTPTPLPATATPLPSQTPTPEAVVENPDAPTDAPADPYALDPQELFNRAQSAMTTSDYEDAIEWLDVLILVDSNYRRVEVRQMLVDAHIAQGRIYLRSQNDDGEDRLAQGVQLIFRADELGEVPGELLYEADFIARYLAARAYVDGGAFDQAREVLTRLCEEDCDWSYRGVSVRDLLAQSGGS